MQDRPAPSEILAAVAEFLRVTVVAESTPRTAFQARVAANALDLVRREIELAPAAAAAEAGRLRAILGDDGDLADQNARLAEGLACGRIDYTAPEVWAHLWASTREKLAVDQPGYSGYLASLAPEGS